MRQVTNRKRFPASLIGGIVVVLAPGGEILSHPGGVNHLGCHVCRSNCETWGVPQDGLHCHEQRQGADEAVNSSAWNESGQLVGGQPDPDPVFGDSVYRVDYRGFTVWVDCDRRAAVRFRYNAQRDSGELDRSSRFHLDPGLPDDCQQASTDVYPSGLDRGHLVPANHLDHDPVGIQQANFMTNIKPQVAQMNRGAWLMTEELVECHRDQMELLVVGGPLWLSEGDVIPSHGVEIPSHYWKLVVSEDQTIAWVIPNSVEATRAALDSFRVLPADLETVYGLPIPEAGGVSLESSVPQEHWGMPDNCDRS